MRDLVVLVPDKNTEYVVRGGLARGESLGIRDVDFEIVVDPGRDGGVRSRGVRLLALQKREFSHALLMFDYDGSGADMPAAALEGRLDTSLSEVWGPRAKAIVIEPEVDVWMWGAESHLKEVVEWPLTQGIHEWLQSQGFHIGAERKPERPKEALEAVVRRAQMPRSSSYYQTLASRISLKRCHDAAFLRLREALSAWFPLSK